MPRGAQAGGRVMPDRIAISDIRIGERIREDKGDIAGMAESLRKYGCIEPIVIAGEDNTLICGERRLLGAKALDWPDICVHVLWGKTPEERWQMEREENEQRKALTGTERAKGLPGNNLLVEKAKQTGTRLSSMIEDKKPRGNQRAYDVPKQDIAQALGISVGTLVNAEQHVAAVERYPELESLTQQPAIETAKRLDRMPEPEREEVRQTLQALPVDERRRIAREQARAEALEGAQVIAVAGDAEGRVARAVSKAEFSKAISGISQKILSIDLDEVSAVLTDEDWSRIGNFIYNTRTWLDRLEAMRPSGLRLVGGQSQ